MKVLTMGTFDLLHGGHVYLIQMCAKIAGSSGSVVIGLNPDQFILDFKGKAPVQSYAERLGMLLALRGVSQVLPTPGADARPLIQEVKPDFIVIGSDWSGVQSSGKTYHDQLSVTPQWLAEQGTAILFLDRFSSESSTKLKERVRAS